MTRFNDDRIQKMIAGAAAADVYPFPGTEDDATPVRIAVRVLTEAEIDEVRLGAQRDLREAAKLRGWDASTLADIDPDLFHRLVERHTIFRAFLDADTVDDAEPARFFEKPADVEKLHSSTTTRLMGLYIEHQEQVSPLRELDAEGVRQLVEALGKAQRPEVFLGSFAPATLRRCVISMASLLRGT